MADARRKTVAVDTGSVTGVNPGSVSEINLSTAIASNANVVSVLINCGRGTSHEASGVTRDGQSYTLAKRSTLCDACFTEIWYLVNPNRDTGDITVTFVGTLDDKNVLGHVALYNVDQRDPVNITDEAVANAGSVSSSFTPTENNCVAVEGQFNTGNTSGSVSAGQTLIRARSAADSGGCSYETDIDATSESVGWTGFETGTTAVSQAVVVFQGCIPSGGGTFLYNMLG